MLHPAYAQAERLQNGDATVKRLFADADRPFRFINIHGFRAGAIGEGTVVKVLRTITRPHLIVAFQPTSNNITVGNFRVDMLLSHDTLEDAEAEIRDTHLSGGRLTTDGWLSNIYAPVWPINWAIWSRHTVYKLAMFTPALQQATFDVNLTLQLL